MPPPRPRSRRTMLILAAAVAVVVIAAVALGLGLSGGSAPGASSPHAGPSAPSTSSAPGLAARQAVAVNNLLGSSAVTRRTLVDALTEVRNCGRVFRAVGQIRSVVDQRSTEYNHALALSTAAMTRGTTVKSDLLAALRHSMIADRDYLTWARQQLNSGCTPASQSQAYRAAVIADQQADASKGAFVQAWNQVAARYGVPQKSPDGI